MCLGQMCVLTIEKYVPPANMDSRRDVCKGGGTSRGWGLGGGGCSWMPQRLAL